MRTSRTTHCRASGGRGDSFSGSPFRAHTSDDRVPIYRDVVQAIQEDVPILYLSKTIIPVAYRDFLKGFGAGAATWFGYYGGGMKNVWLDKA